MSLAAQSLATNAQDILKNVNAQAAEKPLQAPSDADSFNQNLKQEVSRQEDKTTPAPPAETPQASAQSEQTQSPQTPQQAVVTAQAASNGEPSGKPVPQIELAPVESTLERPAAAADVPATLEPLSVQAELAATVAVQVGAQPVTPVQPELTRAVSSSQTPNLANTTVAPATAAIPTTPLTQGGQGDTTGQGHYQPQGQAQQSSGPVTVSGQPTAAHAEFKPLHAAMQDVMNAKQLQAAVAAGNKGDVVLPKGQAAPVDGLVTTQTTANSTTSPLTPQSPLAAATPTTAPQAPPMHLNLGQQGWQEQFGNRVRWMVRNEMQTAELKINPRDLGPIELRVNVRQDATQITMVSPHPQVREAMESAMPRLRDMLAEQGMNQVDVNVSDQSLRQQAQERGEGESGPGGEGFVEGDDAQMHEGVIAHAALSDGDTMVDYYA